MGAQFTRSIVIPALRLPARQALRMNFSQRLKAGISLLLALAVKDSEIPAFAGMTKNILVTE